MKQRGYYSNWFWSLPMLAAAGLLAVIPRPAASQTTKTGAQTTKPQTSNSAPPSATVPAVRTARSPKEQAPHEQAAFTQAASAQAALSAPGLRSAQPAAVTLKDGTLTIEANNSDLDQILRDVSRESGMVIEGQVKSTRIFGVYGPREPGEVLSELLAGQGYNIIMSGTSREGAPRELKLSNRSGGPTPPAPSRAPQQDEEVRLGPGAVAHPPPAQVDDPELRRQVNQRRLQQMHDAQEAQEKAKENEHR